MARFHCFLTAFLAVALCAVALESELPQRVSARLGLWPDLMRPQRDVDMVAADLQHLYPTQSADIVMLGDSLTAEADWRELLPGRDVVNRGVAGQTAAEILARVDGVRRLRPRVIFVMAGINDLTIGQTPEQVAATYANLIDRLMAAETTIVIQAVLHVAHDRDAVGLPRYWHNRRNVSIAELNQRLRALAAERRLAFVDLNVTMAPGGELSDEMTIDGTHLRAKAYLVWAQAVERALASVQPGADDGRAATQVESGRT